MALIMRTWNLEDALSYYDDEIGERTNLSRIFVEPPNVDSDNEEEAEEYFAKTVPAVKCQIVLRSGSRLNRELINEAIGTKKKVNKKKKEDDPTRACDDVESGNIQKVIKKRNSKNNNAYEWVDDSSKPTMELFPPPNYTDCRGLTGVEQLEKFFDDEILSLIAKESKSYAEHLQKPDPRITIAELRDPDLRNELVFKSMRKNQFKQISQFLHFKDMHQPETEQNLAFDEIMVEYFGRHGMKQCMKSKIIPFGFKVWSLCTTGGYLANFEIYKGNNPRSAAIYEQRFGKCISPLFDMIDDFDESVRALPFSFYFDNLFTGIPALNHLKSLGYNATGTIRENRLPEGCPLKEKKKVSMKRGRGYMTSKSIKGADVHVTQWIDNSFVRIASTAFGMKPLATAVRYSSVKKKKNISLYRISIHGKKWWSSMFTWMTDACIQNAWQLHRVAHPEMPQLDFRREIALYYCGHYGVPPKSTGNRKRKVDDSSANLRFDNLSHWPRHVAKRRHCADEACQSTVRTVCMKCDVGLCINCFETYHSSQKFEK
ncbi:PiggyBac transposable element-derived protein 3 [Pseudolycoriella hygida]|uniref:PiggyBac transposable element-derived protein 3 n=1 Tax=Pseudolycoriella hygida TaxID=35572 RepID=A0A9Q0S1G8_9DIPT|nr:PiggyBac transposable element-derived protein 3 [Pseudolycoriella hygida]